MKWNYRAIKYEDGYSVAEVYYDDDGNINGFTAEPTLNFYCETQGGVVEELKRILGDVVKPALNIEDIDTN